MSRVTPVRFQFIAIKNRYILSQELCATFSILFCKVDDLIVDTRFTNNWYHTIVHSLSGSLELANFMCINHTQIFKGRASMYLWFWQVFYFSRGKVFIYDFVPLLILTSILQFHFGFNNFAYISLLSNHFHPLILSLILFIYFVFVFPSFSFSKGSRKAALFFLSLSLFSFSFFGQRDNISVLWMVTWE